MEIDPTSVEAPAIHRAFVPLTGIEVRGDAGGTGDGNITFSGYAAVTGVTTTLYEGRMWVWREVIAPGAFTRVLADLRSGAATYPCVLNHEHDNRAAIAASDVPPNMVGGLELTEDAAGLRVFARLDPCDPDVMRVVPKIRNRTARQMSFAFRVAQQGFTTVVEEDDQGRTIETDTVTDLSNLYDVTVCAHGAYPTTTAEIRGYLAALRRSGIDPEGTDVRRLLRGHAPTNAAPARVGGGDPDRAQQLAGIRRDLRAAVVTHSPREHA